MTYFSIFIACVSFVIVCAVCTVNFPGIVKTLQSDTQWDLKRMLDWEVVALQI